MAETQRIEAVVVGAGQAGLAAGYHLARRGHRFLILDGNERVGDSWRQRWDSLRLFTPARYDGLPGWAFPARSSHYPTKDEVADYLEAYAARFELPVRTRTGVERLSRERDVLAVHAGDVRFEAESVVVATGAYQRPRVPGFAGELDRGILQLHSSEYRRPSQLPEGDVLVVGAGNSGAEIALESSARRRTLLSGRDVGHEPTRAGSLPDRLLTPAYWLLVTRLLTVKTPIGRKIQREFRSRGIPLGRIRQKDLTEAGVERVPRAVGVRDGKPLLEDGRVRDVKTVVWCTGFQPDFGWIDLPVLDADGTPVHERGVVQSEPGLYFLGLYFLHSLASQLVGGVARDADHVVGHIARRSATRPRIEDPVDRTLVWNGTVTDVRVRTASGQGRDVSAG